MMKTGVRVRASNAHAQKAVLLVAAFEMGSTARVCLIQSRRSVHAPFLMKESNRLNASPLQVLTRFAVGSRLSDRCLKIVQLPSFFGLSSIQFARSFSCICLCSVSWEQGLLFSTHFHFGLHRRPMPARVGGLQRVNNVKVGGDNALHCTHTQ